MEGRQLFEKLTKRDIISWNTMISCYTLMGMYREALDLFSQMTVEGVSPDEIAMVSLVSACTKLRDLEMGEILHLYIEENSMKISGNLLNCLVDMYVKYGKMEEVQKLLARCDSDDVDVDVVLWTRLVSGYVKSNGIDNARSLFDQMTERNLISWTTMISGYAQCGHCYESLKLSKQMRVENLSPDEVVLITTLSASVDVGDYEFGKSIHSLVVKYGIIIDGFLGNGLIDLYAKCEELDKAHLIFQQLPYKSAVTWNTRLDGFCRNGDTGKARAFFDEIPEKDNSNLKADKLTLVSLLSSCASVGALNHGIWVHVYINKNQIRVDNMLGTALVETYGRCGCSEMAYDLFSELSEKNVFLWTAMIAAFAMEGHAQKAIDLYFEKEETGIKPDHVTFIALLYACSHGGLVADGYEFFGKMSSAYNIKPKIQHLDVWLIS
ncbi:Pentatricopeptide repeat-containing protein [Melia azedarach]|uniref:Pentatricopeptide repeat-containing protein n=1 Tax=Melia azedarach TaxID=155640 RepID=A0ACC1X9T5_MELAZ|nr:Pentatricopeptide repeat-containing protein [Melia azedarach]